MAAGCGAGSVCLWSVTAQSSVAAIQVPCAPNALLFGGGDVVVGGARAGGGGTVARFELSGAELWDAEASSAAVYALRGRGRGDTYAGGRDGAVDLLSSDGIVLRTYR